MRIDGSKGLKWTAPNPKVTLRNIFQVNNIGNRFLDNFREDFVSKLHLTITLYTKIWKQVV